MKHLTLSILIVAVVTWSDVFATENVYPAYKIPDNSPLSIRGVKKIPPFLYFDGEIEIEVNFIFDFLSDAYNPYVEFTISPTEASLKKLPFLIERGRDELPVEIIMFGKKEAAKVLLGDKIASDVFVGKYPSVTGKASIIIHDLGAGYECDKAVFVARLKKLVELKDKVKISGGRDKVAC